MAIWTLKPKCDEYMKLSAAATDCIAVVGEKEEKNENEWDYEESSPLDDVDRRLMNARLRLESDGERHSLVWIWKSRKLRWNAFWKHLRASSRFACWNRSRRIQVEKSRAGRAMATADLNKLRMGQNASSECASVMTIDKCDRRALTDVGCVTEIGVVWDVQEDQEEGDEVNNEAENDDWIAADFCGNARAHQAKGYPAKDLTDADTNSG